MRFIGLTIVPFLLVLVFGQVPSHDAAQRGAHNPQADQIALEEANMPAYEKSGSQPAVISRKTLRLTFRVSGGKVELVSVEHLAMVTPSQFGNRPEAGRNSGFWLELQDARTRVLAYRLISRTQLNSVEVHSPDGKIERKFGEVQNGVFVALLPDLDDARSVVLMGDPLVGAGAKPTAETAQGSAELARFELPQAQEGR